MWPRWSRIRSITAGSSMLAITRSVPPHCRQVSMSMANTRLRRCAHDIARCRSLTDTSPRAAEAAARVPGTIRARSRLAGANTPWYLVKCARGFGTSAASACERAFFSAIPRPAHRPSPPPHLPQRQDRAADVSPATVYRLNRCANLQATILHQLGLNHETLTWHHYSRDERLNDVCDAQVIKELIA